MRSRSLLTVLAIAALPASAFAQSSTDGVWTAQPAPMLARAAGPARQIYRLDHEALERLLEQAPEESGAARRAAVRLSVPAPDGRFLEFGIEQSPVMAPELAAKFPGIDTFRGQGVDDPTTTVRLDRTPLGFRATVVSTDGVFFVGPESRGERDLYVATRAEGALSDEFRCLVDAFAGAGAAGAGGEPIVTLGLAPSGSTLRQYRLAVAATGEYTAFFGSQANAIAGIVSTVNAVNAVYNVEVTTHLTLIGNNDDIVYTDATTDPFPLSNLNTETQAAIDSDIGDGNYDIGHLFHVAGSDISGNAGCIACVCTSGSKGSGWSQGPDPTNADFTFVVAHEMGHQHGGTHTFNGSNCNPGQYTGSSAWEPGSGSTIMSYSSICGADNQLGNLPGNLYFHAGNRQQITTYTQSGGGSSCGTTVMTGNSIPTVDAGSDYTIPRGTPFVLTASGSDPDGEALTFTWEQMDLGPSVPLTGVDDGQIPLFRSFPPSSSAARTVPAFSDLLAGSASLFPNKLGEQLPSVDRILTFRTTARDNRAGGGAADDDEMVITVSGPPFDIATPGVGGALECNAPSPVNWTVGGGSVAANVNILLSIDGGASFPTVLAAVTPNDGSQDVTAPAALSNDARVRIDSVDNIFFALSPQIAVEDTLLPTVFCPPPVVAECTGNNGVGKDDPQLAGFFAGASAIDACDPTIPIVDDAPPLLPLGDTSVTFTGTDDSSNAGMCSATVTVQDTIAPTISLTLAPAAHWPPNHKLFEVTATVVVDDICDPDPAITLTSITSNEPDDGLGDGDTAGDIQGADFGTEDYTFLLRAERSGLGTGRIYTVTYTVSDGSGNETSAVAYVTIPKSES